jgi:hypothetical protein
LPLAIISRAVGALVVETTARNQIPRAVGALVVEATASKSNTRAVGALVVQSDAAEIKITEPSVRRR